MSHLLTPDYRRVRDEGFSEGARFMREHIEKTFMQWAASHPEGVVRDELWGYVDKLRSFKIRRQDDE